MEKPGNTTARIANACLVAFCIITALLLFLLPAESLVVDLVYQRF